MHVLKCIVLLLIFLSFSCSLNATRVQSKNENQLSGASASVIVEHTEQAPHLELYSAVTDDKNRNEYILNADKEESQIISVQENAEINAAEENGDYEERGQNLLDASLDFINESQEYWSADNLDSALETLDQAYTLIARVDTESYPELIQQKEDLRFMAAKRILEIYSSRYKAVNGNHLEIPLVMNEHVEMEIKLFQGRERDSFIESYKRSGLYANKIKESLREAGLPEELLWLPHIESWFKVKALSTARALGIWQFIPSTGYKFGLKRDTWVDERMDPEKSTVAAIAYLKELHQMFGDWTTVLAAYNCGEGRVLRTIRKQKINYLDNFWDLYDQLPRETARYVPRFLATLHIMKDPAKYGFTLDELELPVAYETVSIQKQMHLKTVADKLGVSLEELNAMNPELRIQVTPPTKYSLKIPSGNREVFLARLDDMPQWTIPQRDLLSSSSSYVYHRVKNGETLTAIARKYRASTKEIAKANTLNREYVIRIGQKLKIPLHDGSGNTYAEKTNAPGGKYWVQKGDSLWLIAKKFNTDLKTLQKINNLRSTNLQAGQMLLLTE